MQPAKILRRVVLPAPEAPIIALTSPALNIPVTPCKIVFTPSLILPALIGTSYVQLAKEMSIYCETIREGSVIFA
jgi:hypothetical protein